MKIRSVSGAVFYDDDFNIAIQIRGAYAKEGFKYGFWGGAIEPGETKEEAMIRELDEELGYSPKKLEYWDTFSYIFQEKGKYEGWKIIQHVFLSPITQELLKAKIHEGDGLKVMKLEDVIKGAGFPKGSTDFLKALDDKLNPSL